MFLNISYQQNINKNHLSGLLRLNFAPASMKTNHIVCFTVLQISFFNFLLTALTSDQIGYSVVLI